MIEFIVLTIVALPIIIISLFIQNSSQSRRIAECERLIKSLLPPNPTSEKKPEPSPPKPVPQTVTKSLPPKTPPPEKKPLAPPATPAPQIAVKKKEPFKIPAIIKDNWMGVFGAAAVVIGAVFFGLTAEIMQKPQARIGSMLVFSLVLIGIAYKMKKHQKWSLFCSWLKAIAGAIILFATLGAGGVVGLQCIDNPLTALIFLCLGISINLFLALRTPSQVVASLHVILSLITLCMIPQAPFLILIGSLVASAGLIAAFRKQWDLHLILIVATFAVQNTIWSLHLIPHSPYLASFSCLLVGCVAAMIHYRKKYQSPEFKLLPLVAHILNWGLLTWNLFLHAKLFALTPLILAVAATAGFILARSAKRKGIRWLYQTDTLIAQMVAMGALISFTKFSIKPIDIALLISAEVLVFNFLCNLQKEKTLVFWGNAFHWTASCSFLILAASYSPHLDPSLFLRLGAATLLNWGYYFLVSRKRFITGNFPLVINPKLTLTISPALLIGSSALLIASNFGLQLPMIPFFTTLFFIGLAVWRQKSTLILSLILLHLINWEALFHTVPLLSIWSFIWLGVLDAALIFGKFLEPQPRQKNVSFLPVYGLAIHSGLLTYHFTQHTNPLICGTLYLGYSLICLELTRWKYLKSLADAFWQVGMGLFLCFLSHFILVGLQVQPVWKGLFVRQIIELLALATLGYWIFFSPKNVVHSKVSKWLQKSLIELFLGFLTLCIFTECPEFWRPLVWACLACTLLQGPSKTKLPKRLYLYSWIYFIASIVHTTFLTQAQKMPSLLMLEAHHIPALLAIAAQVVYAFACFMRPPNTQAMKILERDLFCHPCLTMFLPIFSGIALMLAFNYEKALLTLMWVGLTCVYLTLALFMKAKRGVQISMGALIICSLRLVIFDLTQKDLSLRALVFLGVGSIMLIISLLYKKFKHRLEPHESA